MRKTSVLAALALTLTVGLTACGSQDTSQPEISATEHNDADVQFASDMIQHHAQALSMVDLTVGRPLDPAVQGIVDAIREAQAPEIETMVDWLTAWDEKVPSTVNDHGNAGHDMSDMDGMEGMDEMPGMMSADDIAALEAASDAEFQDMWLRMMIEHHQGAVQMADDHLQNGQYRDAIELAQSIKDSQAREIQQMQELLG